MYARITMVTGATDFDRGIAFLREELVPQLQVQRGYRGLTASGDRAAGAVTVLTLWDTKADLDASESVADKARQDSVAVLGGQPVVERYEEVLSAAGNPPPGPGSKLQIRRTKVSLDRLDENLAAFKSVVLPEIASSPGFQGVRQLIDRSTGQGSVGTVWIDDAALQAADAKLEQHRQAATERGVEFGEVMIREVLFADWG